MKYIKIKAENYNEAMKQLRMEHGDDAIPISHKYIREGGLLKSKLFSKEVVELTAAIQERKTARLFEEKRKFDMTIGKKNDQRDLHTNAYEATDEMRMDKMQKNIDIKSTFLDDLSHSIEDSSSTIENDLLSKKRMDKADLSNNPIIDTKEDALHHKAQQELLAEEEQEMPEKFEKELSEIKDVLQQLMDQNKETNKIGFQSKSDSNEALFVQPFDEVLKDNDYDEKERGVLLKEVTNSISKEDLKDKYKIEKSLKDLLKSKIITTGPIQLNDRKKIVMFIGPTGVGKTTTMAKLGAINSLREGHKVVFVTLDNYRIAATEQLKKYAEIMRIPIHACNDQNEFKEIVDNEKADIIMVDTSGRSHKNELKIAEIKSYADLVDYDIEKILCVSANTKKRDIKDIFRAFDVMEFDSVIITKVDETSYIGNVVDIADKYNKPISYFSNGQEVPNDIIVADPDNLVDIMLGPINN